MTLISPKSENLLTVFSMLVDTDVLIDYLRGNENAVSFIERNVDDIFISSITVAELYQGVFEGEERAVLDELISVFSVIPVSEGLAKEGGLLRRKFKKSHGSGIADCMIAATAIYHKMELVTLNVKHFPMVGFISKPYEK